MSGPARASVAALLLEPFALWHAARTHGAVPLATVSGGRLNQVNDSARVAGVTPGLGLAGALSRAPDLTLVPDEAPGLQAAWEEVLRELPALSPRVEALAPGRALLTLREGDAALLAATYGGQVGLAVSRELALLAAGQAESGCVRTVLPAEEDSFLRLLPLSALRGVGLGEQNLQRLRWLGLRSVGQLMGWSRGQLAAFLGAEWATLRPSLFGPHSAMVAPARQEQALVARFACEVPAHEPGEVEAALDLLGRQVAGGLAGRVARRLALRVSTPGGTLEAVREAKEELREAAAIRRLTALALADLGASPWNIGIEGLELRLLGLYRSGRQGDLWGQVAAREAAELVSRRYPSALRRVRWLNPHALAPDQAFCWVNPLTGEEVRPSPRTSRSVGARARSNLPLEVTRAPDAGKR